MKPENKLRLAEIHRLRFYRMPTVWTGSNNSAWYHQSYASCAADEICKLISEHMDQDPIDLIQDYRETCLDAAVDAPNGDINFMFSTAADVASDFIDLFFTIVGL